MNIQLEGLQNGFTVVDGGKTAQQLNGFRFTVIRTADNGLFHFATAKQVRQLWKQEDLTMDGLKLNLTPDQATALYLALDNTIYFGTDFKDRFTKQQREDVLDIFKQARPYNPQWRKNNG